MASNEAYHVMRDPGDRSKWTIGVNSTGKKAHGARSYSSEAEARAACDTKNRATAHMHRDGRR